MDLGNYDSLLPGERLLWSGRPQRFSLRRGERTMVASGAFCMTIVSTAFLTPDTGGLPIGMPIMFLGIGFALTWGRVIVSQLVLRSTTYLLTDRRLVAVSTRPKHREVSEYLTRLPPPVVKPAADGSGSIGFGAFDLMSGMVTMSGMRRNPFTDRMLIELRAIPDAALVRDQIANAQANAAQGPEQAP